MAYEREVRLGLVLYGGVSLAVYENGIAQELHRAVRGDGVYGLLCSLIDSDIVVDIISGTSAGGVNGVMLAYALANRRAFAPSADLWRNEGDIEALLRKQNDTNASSVLNSTYYQNALADCFQTTLAPDPTARQIGELDLFVTSTDANGAISTVYDDLGHPIDIKSHRALFKLSYRGERKNDLGAPASDLAKLCRMTSCFPVAFEPVRVQASEENFLRWGQLRNPAVYLDGGILNNKPFTSTIDAIATRTANREVERFLIYVEPNPERFAPSAGCPPSPTIVKTAVDALTSIPSYQSIAGDMQAIEAHNQQASQIADIIDRIGPAPETDPDCLEQAGVLLSDKSSCDPTSYYTARLIQIRDAAVEAILNDKKGRDYFPSKEVATQGKAESSGPASAAAKAMDLRRSGRILVQSFDAWRGDPEVTMQQYDVFYRMRRVAHLSGALMRQAKNNVAVPMALWDEINHYFKLFEIAKWEMIRWLTEEKGNFGWMSLSDDHPTLDTQPKQQQDKILAAISQHIWGQVQSHLDKLLHAPLQVPADPTPEARQDFYTAFRKLDDSIKPAKTHPNLLDAIDTELKNALIRLAASGHRQTEELAGMLRNEFCRFIDADRQVFPVLFASDFMSTDVIRVVRFSPLDAQRCLSEGPVENKVRGVTLSAFGGFFKKGWRASDIMVGRLDAVCQLVECLLTKEQLAARASKRPGINITAAKIQQLWKNLDPAQAAFLEKEINTYLAYADDPPPDAWDILVNAIVGVAQREIYCEEYPRVVKCSIEQEYDWGQYNVIASHPPRPPREPYDNRKLAWLRARKKPDQVIVEVAANAIASAPCSPTPPGATPFGAFVEEIPEPVLQELGALAVIRVGKGLLASIPDQDMSKKIAGNLFYKVSFGVIAPVVYRFARMRRFQPSTVVVLNTAIVVLCLTLLAAVILLPTAGWPITALHLGEVGFAALLLLVVWARWFRK